MRYVPGSGEPVWGRGVEGGGLGEGGRGGGAEEDCLRHVGLGNLRLGWVDEIGG